jgi:hypothetical protein
VDVVYTTAIDNVGDCVAQPRRDATATKHSPASSSTAKSLDCSTCTCGTSVNTTRNPDGVALTTTDTFGCSRTISSSCAPAMHEQLSSTHVCVSRATTHPPVRAGAQTRSTVSWMCITPAGGS